MAGRRGSHAEREVFWRGHISKQRVLGVTGSFYCREHGLSESSFHRWRRRLARAESEAGAGPPKRYAASRAPVLPPSTEVTFAELHVVGADGGAADPPAGRNDGAVEVVVSGGRRIRVGPGFDAATFVRIMGLLEGRLPC